MPPDARHVALLAAPSRSVAAARCAPPAAATTETVFVQLPKRMHYFLQAARTDVHFQVSWPAGC
jgi:hypothetical protein